MASISGGDKLEGVLKSISSNLQLKMNVGVLAGKLNHDTQQPIAPYAAANEYGTSTIPARPFMRSTVNDKSAEWAGELGKLIKGSTQDANGITKAFGQIGSAMEQDIKSAIESMIPPPNAESTIEAKRRKGLAQPDLTLVDSGSLQDSISYEIITGEQE